MARWQRLDPELDSRTNLRTDAKCVYAREYVSYGTFLAGETNQLVTNLKMGADAGTHRTPYRFQAIRKMAAELAEIVPDGSVVTAMPPSIPETGTAQDQRLEEVLRELSNHRRIGIVEIVRYRNALKKSRLGGTREPSEIVANTEWIATAEDPPARLWVVDDVITSGGHFEAILRVVEDHWPNTEIIGAFWAKTIQV